MSDEDASVLGRLLDGARIVADTLMAGAVALPFGLITLTRMALGSARNERPERKLVVLDAAWSLASIRERELEHSITCRDLGGFFDHVWSVHPLVGAAEEDRRGDAIGPVGVERLDDANTFAEGRIGRYEKLAAAPRTNFVLSQIDTFRYLDRLIEEEGVSAVRVADPYYLGLFGYALARIHRIPIAIRVGAPWDFVYESTGRPAYPRIFRSRRVEKLVDNFLLPRMDLVGATNEDNLRFALNNGAVEDRCTLFRYGNLIDPVHFDDPVERRKRSIIRDELDIGTRPFIIYVARLEKVKRHEDAIRAVHQLTPAFPDVVCVFAGDGTQRDQLETLATELGISDNVMFVGNQDQRWLGEALPAADVVLSLSTGRALVEGALSGTPVVAYDIEWHDELIDDGENGYLVSQRDIDALGEAIRTLLNDPEHADRLGQAGRKTAMDQQSPEALDANEREAYTAAYQRALGYIPGDGDVA